MWPPPTLGVIGSWPVSRLRARPGLGFAGSCGVGPLTLACRCSAGATAAQFPAGGAFSVPHAVRPAPAAWGTLRTSSLRPQARDGTTGSWAASSLPGASRPPVPSPPGVTVSRVRGTLGSHSAPLRDTHECNSLASVSWWWPPPRASVWRARVERDRGRGTQAACGRQACHRAGLAPAEGPWPAGRPVQPPLPPAVLRAVRRINQAIRAGVAADTVKELRCPEAQLPPVHPCASAVYQQELAVLQRQQQGVRPSPPERLGVGSQPGAASGHSYGLQRPGTDEGDPPCPQPYCNSRCPWAKTALHSLTP